MNVPPLHPNCRCVTAPYFEDDTIGERAARGEDGKTYYVPADITYAEWKESLVDGSSKIQLKELKLDDILSSIKKESEEMSI